MKKFFTLLMSLFLCVGLVGCSSSGVSGEYEGVSVSGNFGEKPEVKITSTKPAKELVAKTLIEGKGDPLVEGSIVTVDYYGITLDGDKPFDESFSKPRPFTFKIGQGVIKGWSQGLVGKKIGSRVLLIVPSELGYGASGNPPSIKPNATLVFVVDIHNGTTKKNRSVMNKAKVKSTGADGVTVTGETNEVPKVKFDASAQVPTQMKTVVLHEGSGEPVKEDDVLEVFPYVHKWGDTEPSDGSVDKEGITFLLPVSKAAGTDAFKDIKVGSRVLFIQPASKGQNGQDVPAYVYVFDIIGKTKMRG